MMTDLRLLEKAFAKSDECDESNRRGVCFYCGSRVIKYTTYEKDHFPVPKSVDGELKVFACRSCHDMKDRVCLEDWPMEWLLAILDDFSQVGRETKLFMAKCWRIAADVEKKNGFKSAAEDGWVY